MNNRIHPDGIKELEEHLRKFLFKTCPTCGGSGYQRWACIDSGGGTQLFTCDECKGKRRVVDEQEVWRRKREYVERAINDN